MPGLFEIDSEGWKAQQKGREPWELVRELLQNALDTGSDVVVKLDTRQRKVIVKNEGGEFSDLSDAYTIFGGDKGSDPTKRGRFGRGLKEAVGGAEKVVVTTTKGRVTFDVPNNERIEDDHTISSGTKVSMKNSEWSKEDFDAIKDYVFKLWPPEGQELALILKNGSHEVRERWEPDLTAEMYLRTVVVDDGVMTQEKRRAEVHLKKAEGGEGDGRVYEMGIPVSLNQPFPFYVDVQQKVPMAEQRNEPDSEYMRRLLPRILNAGIGLLDERELRAEWVTEALNHYKCDTDTQEKWVQRTLVKPDKAGAVVRSGTDADDRCKNYGYQVIDASKLNKGAASAVRNTLPTAKEKAKELHERNETKVEPTEAQREFIEFAQGIAEELDYDGLEFETWLIEPTYEGHYPAADHGDGTIRLNTYGRDWTEVNADNLATLVHEISHEHGDGHGKEWYEAMEKNFAELLVNRME